ncbi:specifically androgen-regulated gene protein [Callorhinchus milii]|uniref:Uncharacterized protein n=1 Tax=Callorhinchus milii TaxID=7868 RepID=A0A4W3GQ27_CALMI|nr:specifically androgen-regulated gene protein [Callorhinchus milii]|eukprot:gi/632963221/ref/XP_007897760.1/ PREDICTED: specifically androgen-regulated gene protein [Callorhinchus milii]
MPISDTGAGVSPMDSVASVGSSGSVASTISNESLDFLTAEERECLMFLEETIESLEEDPSEWAPAEDLKSVEETPKSRKELVKLTRTDLGTLDNRTADQNGNTQRLILPRVVLPHNNKHNNEVDSSSQNAGRTQSGANTLPKYIPKPAENTNTVAPSRRSEPSRSAIVPGDNRPRSQLISFHPQSESTAKQGPPTAPKPKKFPANISFKSGYNKQGDPLPGSHPNSKSSVKVMPKVALSSNEHDSPDVGSASKFSLEQQLPRSEVIHKLGLNGQKLYPSGHSSLTSMETPPIGQKVSTTRSPEPHGERRFSIQRPVVVGGGKAPVGNGSSSVPARGVNPAHPWQLGPTKSSSLQRLSTPHGSQPNASSGLNISAAGNGRSLKSPPQWQLGPTKSSSLQRVSTAHDSQPSMRSGFAAVNLVSRSVLDIPGSVQTRNTPPWQPSNSKPSGLKQIGTTDQTGPPRTSVASSISPDMSLHLRPRPISICSETDPSLRHGARLEPAASGQTNRRSFPITINHISGKFQKPQPKALNIQNTPPGPTKRDRAEALRKLGLLKE